jgi:4'-phosphopantetheinyl transferase
MRVAEAQHAALTVPAMARDVQVWQVDLRQPDAGRRRLAARAALRSLLSTQLDRPPDSLTLVEGAHGKPALAGAGLHFNLTRSGDCCLIVTSTRGPVGIDVEWVRPVHGLERIVRHRFAPEEADAILRLDGERRLRAFFNCWTRKEAYLKATGVGLTAPLDAVTVTVDDDSPAIVSIDGGSAANWTLAALDPGPDLIGAVVLGH